MGKPGEARLAFPALIIGSSALAFGPWMVRLADVTPVASAFWRLALAAPILWALVAATGQRAPVGRRAWGPLAIAGVFFAADLAAWHLGIVRTTLANATLFANASSLFFPLWGFVALRTWPDRRVGVALAVAALGMALLLGRSFELSPEHVAGDLLCLVAAVFYTAYLIVMERARERSRVGPALAVATLAGALALGPVALAAGAPVWPGAWGPLLWLAIGGQLVGQGLVIYAVGHLQPHVSGLGLLIQPIIGAAVGWTVYGEALSFAEFAGAGLVLGALVMVRWSARG